MTSKENYLRAVRFERPEKIPVKFCINPSCWSYYPQEFLCEQISRHKILFHDYKLPVLPYKPSYARNATAGIPYTDGFGCVWETTVNGIVGTVTRHPVKDTADYEGFRFPDPKKNNGLVDIDWKQELAGMEADRSADRAVIRGLRHGHTFLQLCDVRGYQDLMFDMYDESKELMGFIDGLEAFNAAIVNQYLELGTDVMCFAEDLGMQQGPMLSPDFFRKYIKPSYARLMKPVRDKGVVIHMHSDGDIRLLVDDLIEGGVEILNLQDTVNGVDWIKSKFKGKVCIELDVDRQDVTLRGTPAEVEKFILDETAALGSPDGGLMLIYGLYPGIPMANITAIMTAFEKAITYFC